MKPLDATRRSSLALALAVVGGSLAGGLAFACTNAASAPASSAGGGSPGGSGGSGGSGGTSSGSSTIVLLDDLDDCTPELDFEGAAGTWYAYNATCEGMVGEQTPPGECTGEPFVFESLDSGCRARTQGGGFPNSEADGWGYALIGVRFAGPVDLCAYDGLTFTSGGSALRVKVATTATEDDSDHFGVSVSAGDHELGWGELGQEGWGTAAEFDCSAITGLLFQAADPTQFDFWIDDVGLRQGGANGGGGTTGGSGGAGAGGDIAYEPLPTDACDDPDLLWKTGRKTNYTSYPDPGSEECIVYNGCTWAGQFAHCSGVRPESWVASRDIAAVFPDDGLEGHLLCVRSGDRVMVVTAIDTCGDSDCDGCCTQNKGDADALIDLESYTNQRWGLPDGAVEWADLGPNPEACTQ